MARNFTRYNEKTVEEIGEVYGVYALAYGLKDTDNVRVFYIGSGNISERLRHHLSDHEENECIKRNVGEYKCYYWYEEVQGGEDKRKRREADLIDQYKTDGKAECNRINP